LWEILDQDYWRSESWPKLLPPAPCGGVRLPWVRNVGFLKRTGSHWAKSLPGFQPLQKGLDWRSGLKTESFSCYGSVSQEYLPLVPFDPLTGRNCTLSVSYPRGGFRCKSKSPKLYTFCDLLVRGFSTKK